MATRAVIAEDHDQGRVESGIKAGSKVAVPFQHAKKVPLTWYPNQVGLKARPLYVGPFTVVARVAGDNCWVNLGHNLPQQKFHVSVLKELGESARTVPRDPNQPDELLWPGGIPKVKTVTRRRGEGRNRQYLVHFYGQHEVQGKWLTLGKVATQDRHLLAAHDRRAERGLPSHFNAEAGLDLSARPGVPASRSED